MKSKIQNSKSIICFLAAGTLGDIQPYVALGMGLQAVGTGVRVATHPEFRQLVESNGLEYAPLHGNPSEPLTHTGGQSALTYDGSLGRSLRASLAYLRRVRPLYLRMLESAWQACQGSGAGGIAAIVAGLPTTWGAHIAAALEVPCIWAFLQPVTRTRAYPSALLPATFSLGPDYNRLSHRIVETAMVLPWWRIIANWQVKTLGLKQPRLVSPLKAIYSPAAKVLYGYSREVAPPPADWPAHHHVSGYWFLPPDPSYNPPPDLERFIETGQAPLYIGFGSPGNRSPGEILAIVLGALEIAGQRAVLAFPEDQIGAADLPASVYRVQRVAHDWLFPRMAGLVHHGGAGTTAAGLRAGVPAMAAPLAVDQFFWGARLAALGCGPAPIPQRELNASQLGDALCNLASEEQYRTHATRIRTNLLAEDGVTQAVEKISSWI